MHSFTYRADLEAEISDISAISKTIIALLIRLSHWRKKTQTPTNVWLLSAVGTWHSFLGSSHAFLLVLISSDRKTIPR